MELVLTAAYGGLGDHLFLTPIPRLYKEQYPEARVYLSEDSRFRSPETRSLVWEANPYLDGFTPRPGVVPSYGSGGNRGNILTRLAVSVGLRVDCELEPELYDPGECVTTVAENTLVDLNYTSFVGAFSRRRVRAFVQEAASVVLVNPPDWARGFGPHVRTTSLRHYAGLIHNAAQFICFTSGSATLAAALRKPATCLFGYGQSPIFRHSQLHRYVDVSGDSIMRIPHAFYLKTKNQLRVRLTEQR